MSPEPLREIETWLERFWRFIEQSSRGWCEADIAAGADPVRAAAAAERTFAFYTGA